MTNRKQTRRNQIGHPPRPRGPYSPKPDTDLVCPKADRQTRSSFRDECDINKIMARFTETGVITHLNNRQPQYGDAPDMSLHEALNVSCEAQQAWEDLTPEEKAEYGHDLETYVNAAIEAAQEPYGDFLEESGDTPPEPAETPETASQAVSEQAQVESPAEQA